MPEAGFARDIAVVGGCGRVGLPLGIAFAARGLAVTLVDLNRAAVDAVNAGRMPFREDGADEMLRTVTLDELLIATTDQALMRDAECVLIVVGTPLDDHLNPDLSVLPRVVAECAPHLVEGQLVVLRSTVHPGATALVERELAMRGVKVDVAFCPERIAEGRAMTELFELPQIVAARDARVRDRARKLFANLTTRVVELEPEEAELAKLFTNTWRYVKFATANQFWMMASDAGLDFERIRQAVIADYPRAADLPGPGFAAGPCLLKDTMQLAAFSGNDFVLGHAAMMVNEGLPLYVVRRIESRYDLSSMTVGILGMAFKGGSDDRRDSLSYKLRKLLAARAAVTLCSDVHIADDRFVSTEQLLYDADLIILATPHAEYRDLDTTKPVVDVWGVTGRPSVI
jgi:UDP-N-acetyl-D-mannosaminuronic acid dehydrogenase